MLTPLLGRELQHLSLAAMENQWSCETAQFFELGGTTGLPTPFPPLLSPLLLAIALLNLALIPGNRMVHRRQQGIELSRTTVFHRCTREHPDRP